MARFFKWLSGILLILYIVAGVAVFLPQYIGIDRTVVTSDKSNQSYASVIYTKDDTAYEDITSGQKVLDADTESVYTADEYDSAEEVLSTAEGTEISAQGSDTCMRVLMVVPYLGYIYLEAQSLQGILILAIIFVALLLIYVIASIVRAKKIDEEEEEAEDADFYSSLSKRKAEAEASGSSDSGQEGSGNPEEFFDRKLQETDDAENPGEEEEVTVDDLELSGDGAAEEELLEEEMEDEELEDLKEEAAEEDEEAARKEAVRRSADDQDSFSKIMSDIDHMIDRDRRELDRGEESDTSQTAERNAQEKDSAPEDMTEETEMAAAQSGTTAAAQEDRAAEELAEDFSSVASEAAPSDREIGTGQLPDVQAALEAALESQQFSSTDSGAETAPSVQDTADVSQTEPDEIELAMPTHTAKELLDKAYADGLDPEAKKDDLTGITFIDYTDCL